tara:strand:- start:46 stop:531 length:486 start_codon:yes stop_codon:yes gene_type:complete
MKKLLLILLLPFILFGCSKDSNYDGKFTISDIGLSLEEYITGFGEPAFNLLAKTGIINFLEMDMSSSNNSLAFMFGGIYLFIVLFVIKVLGQIFFKLVLEEFNHASKKFKKERQKLKDNHLGIFEKIFKWIINIVLISTGLIWVFAIVWLYVAASIWALLP